MKPRSQPKPKSSADLTTDPKNKPQKTSYHRTES